METKVEESMKIADGTHDGAIVDVEYRTTPQNYKYTDIIIEFEEGKRIKYGVPSTITPDNQLGCLLTFFGAVITVGITVDPNKILVGKKCTFMTIAKPNKEGKVYSNVVKDSLKPRV